MTPAPQIVFLVNLLQDVNIVRPLIHLAAANLEVPRLVLASRRFYEKDTNNIWGEEIAAIAAQTGSTLATYDSEWTAFQFLQGRTGVLVAGSESNLTAHAQTHDVFRSAPPLYLKITLQHGFECVGFLQNREHDIAHGKNVTFAADVICGWCERSTLTSIRPSEEAKLLVTGPSTLLDVPRVRRRSRPFPSRRPGGLICENLHSVRLKVGTDTQSSFLASFEEFCQYAEAHGDDVTFRSHPGGQYTLKNNLELPPNVVLNNDPIYKVDLPAFEWGISAPSSIVFDMIWADIPVALWRDELGLMDASNYEGLTFISQTRDWIDFSRNALARKSQIQARQHDFLSSKRMIVDPAEIKKRFLALLTTGTQGGKVAAPVSRPLKRVLFVANALIPTLQLSFLKPLASDVDEGRLEIDLLTESEMNRRFDAFVRSPEAEHWVEQTVLEFAPDLIVFCRYAGPHASFLLQLAKHQNIATLFHIDDDLLNVPKEIGEAKSKTHNRPERLGAVSKLLSDADLVYCSTAPLRDRFRALGYANAMVSGEIYCSGAVINPPVDRPVAKIGYMGFDHAHDFELVLPALAKTLRNYPGTTFDLFGTIPKPPVLDEFGDRVSVLPPVRNYEDFMRFFAGLNWDIGLCPLADTKFNALKANTKWVEYTSVGTAVVATGGTVYDDCCSDGCGILASSQAEWEAALSDLCTDSALRVRLVSKAQAKLQSSYSTRRLRDQVYRIFQQAMNP